MFKDNIFLETSEKLANLSDLTIKNKINDDIFMSEIEIDSRLGKQIKRNKGKYITITFNDDKLGDHIETLIETINISINNVLKYLKLSKKSKILFVGLGNKDITSDKFGYLMIEKISANNKLYKMYKDVEGITNINSFEFIKSLVSFIDPDVVFIFDSLKAENIERLGTTIQISTGGLYPGSAVSDKVNEISKSTLKRDVICVGIPTIINLESINIDNPYMLISSRDIDRVVDDISSIISLSINRLF